MLSVAARCSVRTCHLPHVNRLGEKSRIGCRSRKVCIARTLKSKRAKWTREYSLRFWREEPESVEVGAPHVAAFAFNHCVDLLVQQNRDATDSGSGDGSPPTAVAETAGTGDMRQGDGIGDRG